MRVASNSAELLLDCSCFNNKVAERALAFALRVARSNADIFAFKTL
jgi:hypothetical protein